MQLGTESKISNDQYYQIGSVRRLTASAQTPYRTAYGVCYVNGLSWKRMLRCCSSDGWMDGWIDWDMDHVAGST